MQTLIHNLASGIDAFSEWCGRIVSWCVLIIVLIIIYDVLMLYLFQRSSAAIRELEWHLFAVIFLLGAAYTLKHEGHVRVDIFYQGRWMNDRRRAWVDLFGVIFLLIPFCVLIVSSAWPFVENSYAMLEGSPDAGGLPFRFILKAVIPVSFVLLILQGVSLALKSVKTLFLSASHISNSGTGKE